MLPPGLYEMILEAKTTEDVGAELLPGRYLVRFEGRTIDDILALGDGREHEQAFQTVARISEINEGLYDTFLSPWVRLWSNEASAEALRLMHPLRLQRFLLSDLNPAMWPIKLMAEAVRKDRRPAASDSVHVDQRACGRGADRAGARPIPRTPGGRMQELTFKAIYNAPFVEALAGLRAPHADAAKQRARDEHAEQLFAAKVEAIKTREEQGGFAEAVLRIMLAVAQAEQMFDARGFRLAQRIKQEDPELRRIPRDRMKAAAREQAFMLRFDRDRALAALPRCCRPRTSAARPWTSCGASATRTARSAPEGEAVLAGIERDPGAREKRAPRGQEGAGARPPNGPAERARRDRTAAGGRGGTDEEGAASHRHRAAEQADARVPGLSGADRALCGARAGDHGGGPSL